MTLSGLTPLSISLVLPSEVSVYRAMIKGNDPVQDLGLLWGVFRVLSAPNLSDVAFCNSMVKVLHDFVSVAYPCSTSGSCQSAVVDSLFPKAFPACPAFVGPVGSSSLAGVRRQFRDGFNRRWVARDEIPRSAFFAWLFSYIIRAQHEFGVETNHSSGFGRFSMAKAFFHEAALPPKKRYH